MSVAAPALLQVDGVSVRFPLRNGVPGARERTVDALREVSVEVPSGGRVGIVGESGSGKSTLARVVLGLRRADAGRVLWDGEAVDYRDAARLRRLRREMQVVFQDPFGSLDPRMTAGAAVAEALQALRSPVPRAAERVRVLQALEEVGLAPGLADRYPHELSGGQCQRVAIARATIARPRLLVCDEAVSALDVSVQAQIVNLLRDLSERHGMALLFISHNLAVVRYLCDSVVVLHRGHVVEQGSLAEVFERPRDAYTRMLLAAVPEPDPALARRRARG
ncbi:MAG TPA: ATP-binding cassette domain-containing protein [Steroidobacteraceae bacterium]|nr:ATP-binding cassette domain-containing protein [Steroidobacteraceae bacterium]